MPLALKQSVSFDGKILTPRGFYSIDKLLNRKYYCKDFRSLKKNIQRVVLQEPITYFYLLREADEK
jgi:hypothetical protein